MDITHEGKNNTAIVLGMSVTTFSPRKTAHSCVFKHFGAPQRLEVSNMG
jgi:hypothetical protein